MEKRVILDVQNVSISFLGIQVLHDVNMQLLAGEIHCLVGENGAGKSTLVKILSGINANYTGQILVDGKPVEIRSAQISRSSGIFSVQQHRDLVPTMNAVENVFLGNYIVKKNGSLDWPAMREKTLEYLRLFDLEIDLNVPVSTLRVSEQGILAICKAIASGGEILLVDEASAPLDNFERSRLYSLLRKLRDSGKGIVYISHHLEEIFALGDRVTVLRNGRSVWTGDTRDIDRSMLINTMTGNKKIYSRTEKQMQPGVQEEEQPIFEFRDVCANGVNHVSFAVKKGEIIGFAGLEGSGKQQVADLMFGLSRHTSGQIIYHGKETNYSHPSQAVAANIGLVPTDRKVQGLVPCRSVMENASLSVINKNKQKLLDRRTMAKRVEQSIKELNIKTSGINQLVEYLSGGNQQKVLLDKWLQTGLDLLLCVEPTEGVDVGARGDIYQIMRQTSEQGKTIVIFSSDIDELLTLCDRIYSMANGQIVREFLPEKAEKTEILSDILIKQEA